MKSLKIIGISLCIFSIHFAQADEISTQAEAKAVMQKVYENFSKLQPYLAEEEQFLSSENNDAILDLVKNLNRSFHTVEKFSGKLKQDPSLEITLGVTKDLLNDALNRFTEGKKLYARWKLQAAAQHCIACHTRHEVPTDFSPSNDALEALSPFARGEFYLATRQFENAKTMFSGVARTSKNQDERMDALRRILLILVRVSPNPEAALKELQDINTAVKLTSFEKLEVISWEEGLKSWISEKIKRPENIKNAEVLIQEGLNAPRVIDGIPGVVELLRATRMLHSILEKTQDTNRKHALYLLGLAYRRLTQYTIPELAPLFLELCIREFPGSDDAKRSYRIFHEIRIMEFSGISGGELPSDVQAELMELRALATGEPLESNLFRI